jgi:hypothetical protein
MASAPVSLYCRPSDIITDSATVTLSAGTAAAAFPLTNAYDRKAHTVFKSTANTCTIRALFGGNVTLQGIALIHHNLTAVTVTNTAGFNTTVSIPTTPQDGLRLDPWKTFIGLANSTGSDWSVALTGSGSICALGELCLVQTWRTLRIRYGVSEDETHGAIIQPTDYGVRNKYGMGVRQRLIKAQGFFESDRADFLALQRDARGPLKNFVLIFDETANDALFVDLDVPTRTYTMDHMGVTNVPLHFHEQQKGLALV